MIAALEPNAAIAQRLVRLDVQRLAHLGACRFVCAAHPLGDDTRGIGQPVVGAPAFEGQRRAVMGEKIGVETLDERKRFEPADEAIGPGRRLSGRCGGCREQQYEAPPERAASFRSYLLDLGREFEPCLFRCG